MAYLRNDAINRVNVHSSVQALAQGAGGIFFLVYMVRAGVSVPMALVAQSAIMVLRFALRPAVVPLAKRFGLKPMVIAGTLMLALTYPILRGARGRGGAAHPRRRRCGRRNPLLAGVQRLFREPRR